MIWMEVFIGDKGKKTEEDSATLNPPSILFWLKPDKSSMASTAQQVDVDTSPVNARPVTIMEVMIEPKAVEKRRASVGPENFNCQIVLVNILPTLRNPAKIKRNRKMSIFRCRKVD
ncbi:MAG TPA: hypothetical protein EYF96_02075 [Nitrospinaceae bacterium]|nr:hypothetical protein [Nitrospinaceae bacterium]